MVLSYIALTKIMTLTHGTETLLLEIMHCALNYLVSDNQVIYRLR